MNSKDCDFRVGDTAICILNNRATLTIGKEYTIDNVESYGGKYYIMVYNDVGYLYSYDFSRFMTKSDMRKFVINDILK